MSLQRHHRERLDRDQLAADQARRIQREVAAMRRRELPVRERESWAQAEVEIELRGNTELNRRGLIAASVMGARVHR